MKVFFLRVINKGDIRMTNEVLKIIGEIGRKIDKGEKTGTVKCPCCGGTISYSYENSMAMRAKCDTCDFRIIA